MDDIISYMSIHLGKDPSKRVVIVGGGNDVPTGKYTNISVSKIAEEIIEAGKICVRDFCVGEVFISSLLPRESFFYQLRWKEINDILREECRINGFVFIENRNIILSEHICHDGVHLNAIGSSLLCKNILCYLNKED